MCRRRWCVWPSLDGAMWQRVTCNITSCCCCCVTRCLIAAGTVRRNLLTPSVIAESWRVVVSFSRPTDNHTATVDQSFVHSCLYIASAAGARSAGDVSCDIALSTCAVYAKICAHAQLRIRRLVIHRHEMCVFSGILAWTLQVVRCAAAEAVIRQVCVLSSTVKRGCFELSRCILKKNSTVISLRECAYSMLRCLHGERLKRRYSRFWISKFAGCVELPSSRAGLAYTSSFNDSRRSCYTVCVRFYRAAWNADAV